MSYFFLYKWPYYGSYHSKKTLFLFFTFWHFWWKQVFTKFLPNFVLLRSHHKDVKSENIFEICLSIQKIWLFERSIFYHFVTKNNTKWWEIQITKCYIFWLDRHNSKMFWLLTSLWWLLSETIIRYPIILKTKFGGNFVKSFSRQKCQNLKNKKPLFFWNGEFFIVSKLQVNYVEI